MFVVCLSAAEIHSLKEPEKVENLQDQSQVLLGQHVHSAYPNQTARWHSGCFLSFWNTCTALTFKTSSLTHFIWVQQGLEDSCSCCRPSTLWVPVKSSSSSFTGPSAVHPWRSCCVTCSKTEQEETETAVKQQLFLLFVQHLSLPAHLYMSPLNMSMNICMYEWLTRNDCKSIIVFDIIIHVDTNISKLCEWYL